LLHTQNETDSETQITVSLISKATNTTWVGFRGPIYKISYDRLAIMPKLRSSHDRRLICKTVYKERKAFLTYDTLAKS